MRKILAAAAVLCMVSVASAAVTLTVDGPYANGAVAGTVTYDLHMAIDGERYQSHEIASTLGTGTFYQDTFGGFVAPNPLFIPSFPALAYDSFLTTPYDYPNTDPDDPAFNGAATPGSVGNATTMTGGIFLAGNPSPTAAGDYILVRLTVSEDAVGMATGRVVTTENLAGYNYEIVIPEPSTMALLALGGLALIRRR